MEFNDKLKSFRNVINSRKLKFSEPLKLNLQFFAEGGEGSGFGTEEGKGEGASNGEESGKGDGSKKVELTTEELQKKVEAESDRKLAKALEKQKKDWEKEKQQAIEDAKKDAANYAKMTKQQQEEADYNKRMKDLEDRERQLNLKQLHSEVESDLKSESLPLEFASYLVTLDDNEKIKDSIKGIKKTFEEAVNAAVKEKLRQDTPPGSGSGSNKADNYGKKLAQMNKKNSTNYQDAQANYFKNGGNQ